MRRIKRALKRVLVFGIRNPRRKPREASNLQGATSGALRGGAVAGTKALCCARCCPHTKAPHREDCSAERFALCGAGTTFPCTVLMAASPARDAYRSSGQRHRSPTQVCTGSSPARGSCSLVYVPGCLPVGRHALLLAPQASHLQLMLKLSCTTVTMPWPLTVMWKSSWMRRLFPGP